MVRSDLAKIWQPLTYSFAVGGFSTSIEFPTCKISEKMENEWKDNFSLPAMVARAQIEALKTASNANARYEAKKRLIRMLYERKYERDEVFEILRYLDWMMHLSEDLEKRLLEEIRTFQSETYPEMTKYVTSWERFAKEEGRHEAEAELAIRLLQKRFGKLSNPVQEKIAALSAKLLDELFDAVLEFASKEELTEWLKARSQQEK